MPVSKTPKKDNRFKKGQPGGPGRPKGSSKVAEVLRDLALPHAELAMQTLVKLCTDRVKVMRYQAACAILDRAYGKPRDNGEGDLRAAGLQVILANFGPPPSISGPGNGRVIDITSNGSGNGHGGNGSSGPPSE